MDRCTCRHFVIDKDDLAAACVVCRCEQHAFALDTGNSCRCKIGDDDDLLSDQLFRLVVSLDRGYDHALLQAVVHSDLVAAVALSDLLALEDLADTHVHSTEVIDIDLILDRIDRIGISVNDLLFFFRLSLLAEFGDRCLLFRRLRRGEIEKPYIAVLIDRIEEQVKSRSLFFI